MPNRLSKLFSPSDKEKEALAEAERRQESPPPGYAQAESGYGSEEYDRDNAIDPPDITAGFSNLKIVKGKDGFPATEEVIAHLKLLECFYRLKQSIGSRDGLFGIYNELVTWHGITDENKTAECLAKLAEKRWAIFVQRAVDRYEAWLNIVDPTAMPSRRSWLSAENRKGSLVEDGRVSIINRGNLPPVDVLMVWHAHMLNPRAYLEDCIRQGRMNLWRRGLPWSSVAESIDSQTFAYNPGAEARERWESVVDNSPWDGLAAQEGGLNNHRVVKCHRCNANTMAPWTTCADGQFSKKITMPDALLRAVDQMLSSGEGYCDKDFELPCGSCRHTITHDTLQAGKFCQDIEMLLKRDRPLGGTVLGLTGIPGHAFGRKDEVLDDPNKLFVARLGSWVLGGGAGQPRSMDEVRDRIEEGMHNRTVMRKATNRSSGAMLRKERIALRKMMSRYWDNSGPFALDLVGAVIRQGSFIEKMHNIDWLHSPALPSTVGRLAKKYEVFVQIMRENPTKMAVPTLDVDLAWHTHQLTPQNYMKYTVTKCKQFIDHDDKVTETKLND